MKAPCFKCENRTVSCHSTCEKYLAYREERQEENRARLFNNKSNPEYIPWSYEKRNYASMRRRGR
jgi:hypothetical protein